MRREQQQGIAGAFLQYTAPGASRRHRVQAKAAVDVRIIGLQQMVQGIPGEQCPLPIGGELEYADPETLKHSLENRR